MVSVLPATVTEAVRTVAAAALALAVGALCSGDVPAEAAVMPPTAATAARPMPAMMILGCRMIYLLGDVHYLLKRIVDVRCSPDRPEYHGGQVCAAGSPSASPRARMPRPA